MNIRLVLYSTLVVATAFDRCTFRSLFWLNREFVWEQKGRETWVFLEFEDQWNYDKIVGIGTHGFSTRIISRVVVVDTQREYNQKPEQHPPCRGDMYILCSMTDAPYIRGELSVPICCCSSHF